MLTLNAARVFRYCDGTTRRDFLTVGTLGLGALALPQLLAARAATAKADRPTKDTSVIWLWLAGGAPHIETFDPKMDAPAEYRSVTGEVKTNVPGITLGGNFPLMARHVDKLALVRSFAHRNSGHGGGTHWVMTGYDNRAIDNGGLPTHPSIGSVAAKARGANHPVTGMPTYVGLRRIAGDAPAWLGPAYGPFSPFGQTRKNMTLGTTLERLNDRRVLLAGLDRLRRDVDASGLMAGVDAFQTQAFDLILGNAAQAFDADREPESVREKYGKRLGRYLLTARRLCEAGCGFVTINYGGWDMHSRIKRGLDRRAPALDQAVSAFLEDVHERGLTEKILLVITGEFGRTPRVNRSGGRDHWAPLSTLALAGGGLQMGGTVGESSRKAELPKTSPVSPQDLMATILHVLGIDPKIQFVDQSGRPVYMIEDGQPIRELL